MSIVQADAIDFLRSLPAGSVDLVFGSPPYMDARLYLENGEETGSSRDCQEWVDWMLLVTEAAVRASKGLVLWVVSGVQRNLCYWPGCEGLAWEWWKRGNQLWRPVIWWKVDENEGGCGIPGSGGKQWLRADWEYVLAFKREGWLPWADPLVMGHAPVIDHLGGKMSNRNADGTRANDDPWKTASRGGMGIGGRRKDGEKQRGPGPSRRQNGDYKTVAREKTFNLRQPDGTQERQEYGPPKIANPGNVLPIVVKARVGGGHMGGDAFCSQGEAPFPEGLAEFFVQSFAPPGGLVCDPFSGSGTTACVSIRHGRLFTGCDLRASQVELGLKRLAQETPMGLFAE